jgi:drug/metabolite transporter (DMT)-like permease
VGLIAAVALLGERPSMAQLLGGALVLTAVMVLIRQTRSEAIVSGA